MFGVITGIILLLILIGISFVIPVLAFQVYIRYLIVWSKYRKEEISTFHKVVAFILIFIVTAATGFLPALIIIIIMSYSLDKEKKARKTNLKIKSKKKKLSKKQVTAKKKATSKKKVRKK